MWELGDKYGSRKDNAEVRITEYTRIREERKT
jgi:hypothetical protein